MRLKPSTARPIYPGKSTTRIRPGRAGELAPAPALIRRLARDAQHRSLVEAVIVKPVDVVHLNLEVDADSDARVGEFVRVWLLGMQHQGESADPKNCQRQRCSFAFGVDLDNLCADDFVVKLQ